MEHTDSGGAPRFRRARAGRIFAQEQKILSTAIRRVINPSR
jgi:hypothetical protein